MIGMCDMMEGFDYYRARYAFPRWSVTAIKLSNKVSEAMFFPALMKIQQGSGGSLLAGRVALTAFQARIGTEQFRQPFQQSTGRHIAEQQIQRLILNCLERHRPVYRLRVAGLLAASSISCANLQQRFHATQIQRRIEVLPDRLGCGAGKVFQPQTCLEQTA
ncbi:MAG: hypothetical protein ACRER2_13440 [Methylococcales bacterium]